MLFLFLFLSKRSEKERELWKNKSHEDDFDESVLVFPERYAFFFFILPSDVSFKNFCLCV